MKISVKMILIAFLCCNALPIYPMEMLLSDIMKVLAKRPTQGSDRYNLCSLPAPILQSIAEDFKTDGKPVLTWHDISAVQKTCRYLNQQFHAPNKTILVKYRQGSAESRLNNTIRMLRKIRLYPHANNIVLNLTELFGADEATNASLLDNFFKEIERMGLSHRIAGLDISYNKLKTLPEGILGLTELVKLNLGNNPLPDQEIEKIKSLRKLKKLNVARLKITRIPDAICTLPLTDLDLSINAINSSELIKLCGITTLKTLTLSTLQLKTLPVEIKELQKLQSLDLSVNKLPPSEIEKICPLTNLKSLSLDSNHLSTLPDDLRNLQQLRLLTLHQNGFSEDEWGYVMSILPLECEVLGQEAQ